MTLWLMCDKNTKENGFLGGEGRGGPGEGVGIYMAEMQKKTDFWDWIIGFQSKGF